MTGARSWDTLAVPLPSCLALGNHFLSLKTQGEAVMPVTTLEKYERENKPHIYLHSAL